MKNTITPLAFALSLLAVPFVHANSPQHWSYSGEGAPARWGKLNEDFAVCEQGFNQSPVDIKNIIKGALPPLALAFQAKDKSIINNGHTIQLNVKDGDTLMLDGNAFILQQFHFHAPSENRINGHTYPLEVHFVHTDAKGALAVVSVMFAPGEANPVIADILKNLPADINVAQPLKKPLALSWLIPGNKSYYRYSGSLTTPPCTEGVRWLVMKEPVTLSKEQIVTFQAALGQQNNRPVQPLNGRIIVK